LDRPNRPLEGREKSRPDRNQSAGQKTVQGKRVPMGLCGGCSFARARRSLRARFDGDGDLVEAARIDAERNDDTVH
jgi:hypothetical protein